VRPKLFSADRIAAPAKRAASVESKKSKKRDRQNLIFSNYENAKTKRLETLGALPLLLFTSDRAISALYRRSGLNCCPKNGDVPKLPLSENSSTDANRQARKYLNN
jgi:hypothetical protein